MSYLKGLPPPVPPPPPLINVGTYICPDNKPLNDPTKYTQHPNECDEDVRDILHAVIGLMAVIICMLTYIIIKLN